MSSIDSQDKGRRAGICLQWLGVNKGPVLLEWSSDTHRITTFPSTMDHIYVGGPIRSVP